MTKTKCDLCGIENRSLHNLSGLSRDTIGEQYRMVEVCYQCEHEIKATLIKAHSYIDKMLMPSFIDYSIQAVLRKLRKH